MFLRSFDPTYDLLYEVDIFDGDTEPAVFHKNSLTSKVPLRNVCEAIAKYAFVTSPYPIMISAEVHCCLAQQDMIAEIMRTAFGDALITAPVKDRQKLEVLPSPEDLKGRILIKVLSSYTQSNNNQVTDAYP